MTEVRRWRDEIGGLQWAAVQDWMCEPHIRAKTGLTVADHQRKTIESFMTLKSLAPEISWAPVLQGQTLTDYWRHVDSWIAAGVELVKQPIVGVGSICRLQKTEAVQPLLAALWAEGIKTHGLGLKRTAFKSGGLVHALASSDSLAWSTHARMNPGKRMAGCSHGSDGNGSCANCFEFAMHWRGELLARLNKAKPWTWQERMAPVSETVTHLEAMALRSMVLARMTFEKHPGMFSRASETCETHASASECLGLQDMPMLGFMETVG